MVAIKGRKSSNKNPPIFSHEFLIQNHGDIVSCIAMVFVVGLMVQATSPWAYTFIAIHHNVSSESENPSAPVKYSTGWKDGCAVFFYFLITIVMHAVFQEFIFDKISKRLHLSKVKHAKFNESGQLVIFYVLSILWGLDIIIREEFLLNVNGLWKDYPAPMSFSLKLFFIGQLAYWLHCYPELYFQRTKKEEILPRVVYATIGLAFTLAAYLFNFQQMGVILLVLHYIGDTLLHGARIIHFINRKEKMTRVAFLVGNSVYVFGRVATLAIGGLVFLYGLGQVESRVDYTSGNMNVPAVRFLGMGALVVFEGYLSYLLITREMKRARENAVPASVTVKPKQKLRKKEGKKSSVIPEDDDLPEVDQATKKNLRSRNAIKTK